MDSDIDSIGTTIGEANEEQAEQQGPTPAQLFDERIKELVGLGDDRFNAALQDLKDLRMHKRIDDSEFIDRVETEIELCQHRSKAGDLAEPEIVTCVLTGARSSITPHLCEVCQEPATAVVFDCREIQIGEIKAPLDEVIDANDPQEPKINADGRWSVQQFQSLFNLF